MESRVVDLLIQNVRDNKADTDAKFLGIHDQLMTLDEKVDKLLAFKWRIVGASTVVSIIVGALFHLFIALLGKGHS